MNKMKLGNAPTGKHVSPELFKYMGEEGTPILTILINDVLKIKKIPKDWQRNSNNFRRITLGSATGTLFLSMSKETIRNKIQTTLEQLQSSS